jgi:hypothetical protein
MSQLVARLAQPFSIPNHAHTRQNDELPEFDVDTLVFCLVSAICSVVLLSL